MIDYAKINILLDELTDKLNDITKDISQIPPLLSEKDLDRLKRRIYYRDYRSKCPKYLEYLKEWRKKNAEYHLKYDRLYRELTRDIKKPDEYYAKMRAYSSNYYQKNRLVIMEKMRDKYKNNRHLFNKTDKPNKIYNTKRRLEELHTELEDFITVKKENITLYFD